MQCALDSKAKVEAAVLVAQRWILAALRHRTFYHLNELNAAIGELLDRLNDRVMRHVKQSRRALFERLDRPALKALPAQPYEYAEWGQARVNIDYHISIDDHFYSAPYTLTHETLWYRASHRTVELFHQGKRIASHVRSFKKYSYTTEPEHRPASHRAHLEWTPSRLIQWGQSIGMNTAAVIEYVIRSKPHPEQGYRSALGILRLAKKFDPSRLERACEKALAIQAPSYKAIKTLLEQRMEAAPLRGAEPATDDAAAHLGAGNVRGRGYYH
jgi:transposase